MKTKVILAYFKPGTDFVTVFDKTESGSEEERILPVTDDILLQSHGFIGRSIAAHSNNPFGVVAEVCVHDTGMELVRLGHDYPRYRVVRVHSHKEEGGGQKTVTVKEIFFEGNFLELNRAFPRDPQGRRESSVDQIAPVYMSGGGVFENSTEIKYTKESAWMSSDGDPRSNPAEQMHIHQSAPVRSGILRRELAIA